MRKLIKLLTLKSRKRSHGAIEQQSDIMNAALRILEDQIEIPMESRIAKLESDVGHIKDVINDIKLDVRQTQVQIKAANDSIAALQSDVSSIKATIPHLATKADLKAVEGSLSARQFS